MTATLQRACVEVGTAADCNRCIAAHWHPVDNFRLIPAFAGLPSKRQIKHPKRTRAESAKFSLGGAEFVE
jgi:hypothetical protein